MRDRFEEQLALLKQELIAMGDLCEEIISLVSAALMVGSAELAAKVAPLEKDIDRKEKDIESICLRLLLQQQPVARDLRQISAALKMITDMERIGEQAEDIAEIIPFLNGHTQPEQSRISKMSKAAIKMVTDSVNAYVNQDINTANDVISSDDTVDDYFNKVRAEMIDAIAQNPDDGEYAVDIIMIAKYFERIGDHAANIAEWVRFSVTGRKEG